MFLKKIERNNCSTLEGSISNKNNVEDLKSSIIMSLYRVFRSIPDEKSSVIELEHSINNHLNLRIKRHEPSFEV